MGNKDTQLTVREQLEKLELYILMTKSESFNIKREREREKKQIIYTFEWSEHKMFDQSGWAFVDIKRCVQIKWWCDKRKDFSSISFANDIKGIYLKIREEGGVD